MNRLMLFVLVMACNGQHPAARVSRLSMGSVSPMVPRTLEKTGDQPLNDRQPVYSLAVNLFGGEIPHRHKNGGSE